MMCHSSTRPPLKVACRMSGTTPTQTVAPGPRIGGNAIPLLVAAVWQLAADSSTGARICSRTCFRYALSHAESTAGKGRNRK